MRAIVVHVLFLVLFPTTYSVNATLTTSDSDSLDDRQKSNLHGVVSQMIGVNEGDVDSRRWSAEFGGGRRSHRLPPRYIRRLYEQYRNGYVVHGADTVRSVNAELALVRNSILYVFDLSPVGLESEDVVYGEIHIYKRRRWSRRSNRSPRFPDVDVVVNVFEVTPSSLLERTSLTVNKRSHRWQTLNVTDVVSACVERSTLPRMIAVSFADMLVNGGVRERAKMRASSVRFSSFRRRFSRPLLIVYSRQKPDFDDDDNNEKDQGYRMLQNVDGPGDPQTTGEEVVSKAADSVRKKTGQVYGHSDRKKSRGKSGNKMAMKQRYVDHSTEQEVTPSHNQDIITESQKNSSLSLSGGVNRRRVDQNFEREKQNNSSVATPSVSKHTEQMSTEETANAVRRPRRRKRGISDNEVDLPDDDMEQSNGDLAPFAGYANYQHPSPNLLHGPTSQQRVSPASTTRSIYIKHEDTDELPDSVFNTIRQKDNTREKRRNGRVRGRKRKQSYLLTLLRQPDKFNNTQQSVSGDMCKKKRLQVNFNDIGWGEWVIAPQFFDAFYCGGFCSFPISRRDLRSPPRPRPRSSLFLPSSAVAIDEAVADNRLSQGGSVHALIASRLDYCNSVLYQINTTATKTLQSVLHSFARLVCGSGSLTA